jgi:hypothetical protein
MSQELPQEVPQVKPKKNFNFGPNDLSLESHHITRWHVFAPEGIEIEDLLKKEAWAHIAARLRPMARITVTSEPGHYAAELIVMSAGQLWANVKILSYKKFDDVVSIDANDQFEAKWISNRYKFGIYRKSDGALIEKDLPDIAAANVALANHVSGIRKVG